MENLTMTNQTNSRPVAVITGGSAGLGLVLARFLAAQGYDLIITGRNAGRLNAAVEEIQSPGGTVQGIAGDVAHEGHRRKLADAVALRGWLDLLVNNASALGPLPMPELIDYPLGDLRQVLEVNTIAPLALVQTLRPWLGKGRGLVVDITSDAARGGYEGWGGYGASKAALELLTLTLANELRAEGIYAVVVDPGDMRTGMHQDAYPGEDISDRPLPDNTLPFWAWLLGQKPEEISGQRFQAQAERWEVAT
jgi:NAD(P)-dependent dehydrogenase (short-subunit alcohol dehydrogenase family)